MLVSSSKGQAFQRREVGGGASVSTTGPANGAPYWVKLERIGSTINAYSSADGAIVDAGGQRHVHDGIGDAGRAGRQQPLDVVGGHLQRSTT